MKQVEAAQQTADSREQFERLYALYADDVLRMAYFYLADRHKSARMCLSSS